MKQACLLLAGIAMAFTGLAQVDSTKEDKSDTIRIGNMIIIKKQGHSSGEHKEARSYKRRSYKPENISTNWFIVDIGFTNLNDQTDYTSAGATDFAPGLDKDDFKLRTGKSSNVNIWVVMQRLNLIKHVVNLKYGVGIEMNNYRYKKSLLYNTDPTQVVLDEDRNYRKNKLAADYLTAPIMLNFNFTPRREKGFGFSVGMSAGYLYSSRQKMITHENGKEKKHDDFDLRPWKLSYIAEVQLGPVKLYGSYATQSIFEKGLDQTPYSVGVRLSNW
mgnify:FL=1|jgi:hypothetical protein